jgi:hypothetical protein
LSEVADPLQKMSNLFWLARLASLGSLSAPARLRRASEAVGSKEILQSKISKKNAKILKNFK